MSNNTFGSGALTGSQGQSPDRPRKYGATVEIFSGPSGTIFHHLTSGAMTHQPLIRSYKDGVRIGCTFIDSESIEKIYKMHQEYLRSNPDYKTHQEGY